MAPESVEVQPAKAGCLLMNSCKLQAASATGCRILFFRIRAAFVGRATKHQGDRFLMQSDGKKLDIALLT